MTREILARLVRWTKVKFRLATSESEPVFFHEREMWWGSIGANVGFEQDGKNDDFERPLLVIKKFNKHLLWVLPTTSKYHKDEFHFETQYTGMKSWVILSQIRTISSRRLQRKIRRLPKKEFEEVKARVRKFLL